MKMREVGIMGDRIGEESGKVIGTRILPSEGGRPAKMEVTIQTQATYLGHKGTDVGTYVAYERIPGQIYGEGQGVFRTDEGEGVTWNGMGVGTPTGEGMGMKWSAAVTYQTNSKKLARLNGIVGMVEHETDAQGNAKVTAWEWKSGK
jgi:hypothetical protein